MHGKSQLRERSVHAIGGIAYLVNDAEHNPASGEQGQQAHRGNDSSAEFPLHKSLLAANG
jgi:hypothetical protein